MSRKNLVYDFKPLVGGDMSQASLLGTQTDVSQYDTVTYEVKWTGGQATNGNIGLEYSKDGSVWNDLDFATTIASDGASGNHQLIINEIGFKYLRPKYTRTNGSASGALNFGLFCTVKGA